MTSFLIVFILFTSAFISGLAVFFVKRDNTNLLKLILSFSGAYLFSITVLHLIPHVYSAHGEADHSIGLYVLGGFLFQLLLEQFSHGIGHGHIHAPKHQMSVFPIGILVSLCLHAFLEGMPLASNHQNQLVFGIAIHHIPAAFALASLLVNTSLNKTKISLYLALFAAMTPLGYLVSQAVSAGDMGGISQHFDKMMAVVIGIFLHISTTILFESGSANHHHFNRQKLIAVLVGVAIALLNFLFESPNHHHHHGHSHGTEQHDHSQDPHNHDHDHDHKHDHTHDHD